MDWHVTLAIEERVAPFGSDAARTEAARAVARVGGKALLLFCVADDHLHLVLRGERARVGQLAGNVSLAVRRVAAVPLERARIRPVTSRSHLENLVPYVLDQTTHHHLSTAVHPALWPGSCFPDLVGARRLPGFTGEPLREALPRLTDTAIYAAVGLKPVTPASDQLLAQVGLGALGRATEAAFGLTDLRVRTMEGLAARRVVCRLARIVAIPPAAVRAALGLGDRTATRLAASPEQPDLERAVRTQIALRSAAAATDPVRAQRSARAP